MCLLAAVTGCTSESPPSPDETAPVTASTPTPIEASTAAPSSSTEPTEAAPSTSVSEWVALPMDKRAIPPDPELVAAMVCEPLNQETAEYGRGWYGPPPHEPVQVKVGEGLQAGEYWWVVVIDQTMGEFTNHAWLTNQPGLTGTQGTWINITGGYYFVQWTDLNRFVRAQSALSKAISCLE